MSTMYTLPSSIPASALPWPWDSHSQFISTIEDNTSAPDRDDQWNVETSAADRAQSQPSEFATEYKWINIVKPSQAKDRRLMTDVRRHAMNHHLAHTARKEKRKSELNNVESTTVMPRSRSNSGVNAMVTQSLRRRRKPEHVDPPRQDSICEVFQTDEMPDSLVTARNSPKYSPRLDNRTPPAASQPVTPAAKLFNQLMMPCYGPLTTPGSGFDPFHMLPPAISRGINVARLKRYCVVFFVSEGLRKYWGPKQSNDRLFFLSSLCIAALHANVMYGDVLPQDTSETLRLETDVVELLREHTEDPHAHATDSTIAAVMHVACAGNYKMDDSLQELHYRFIRTLVGIRGGLHAIGEDLAPLLVLHALASAFLRERPAHDMFLREAEKKMREDGLAMLQDPSFESPVCYAGSNFSALMKSPRCTQPLLQVLQLVRHLTDLASNPLAYAAKKDLIHLQLSRFPSAMLQGHICVDDYIYESCRLAALIYERALFHSTTLSAAAHKTNLTSWLKLALKKTDTEHCWGDMAGVLFWVTLVGAAAAHQEPERPWLVGAAMRVMIVNSFEHGNAMTRALCKLMEVQKVCEWSELASHLVQAEMHGDEF